MCEYKYIIKYIYIYIHRYRHTYVTYTHRFPILAQHHIPSWGQETLPCLDFRSWHQWLTTWYDPIILLVYYGSSYWFIIIPIEMGSTIMYNPLFNPTKCFFNYCLCESAMSCLHGLHDDIQLHIIQGTITICINQTKELFNFLTGKKRTSFTPHVGLSKITLLWN